MRLIKPYYIIMNQEGWQLPDILKHIEKCGRTCYKSEDRITEESAPKFVDMLISKGHTAVLEHGTVYLRVNYNNPQESGFAYNKWLEYSNKNNAYSIAYQVQIDKENPFVGYVAITTNYRYIIENGLEEDLKYLCEPTEYHEKRFTVKFICDLATHNSFRTYRSFARQSEHELEYEMSGCAESTRFCNYSKDRFGGVTFIIPDWLDIPEGSYYSHDIGVYRCVSEGDSSLGETVGKYSQSLMVFLDGLSGNGERYLTLIDLGWKPEQARSVLPQETKTELVMTGLQSQWRHFFNERTASSAHSQARQLAIPLKEEFIKNNWI